jgi:hypothetical protein
VLWLLRSITSFWVPGSTLHALLNIFFLFLCPSFSKHIQYCSDWHKTFCQKYSQNPNALLIKLTKRRVRIKTKSWDRPISLVICLGETLHKKLSRLSRQLLKLVQAKCLRYLLSFFLPFSIFLSFWSSCSKCFSSRTDWMDKPDGWTNGRKNRWTTDKQTDKWTDKRSTEHSYRETITFLLIEKQ